MSKLKNKAAVVTGTSKGTGASIATHVAAEGAKVVVDYASIRDFYRSYIAAANARDFDAIANVVAENVKLNGKMVKREDIITEFKKLVDAVPDFKWNLEDLVVDGDRIGARLRDTGTPKAKTFFGQNPDKKSVEFSEYGSYRVRDGLFVEMWYLIDVTSISQQLQN